MQSDRMDSNIRKLGPYNKSYRSIQLTTWGSRTPLQPKTNPRE